MIDKALARQEDLKCAMITKKLPNGCSGRIDDAAC
jgi:hypothetical protein